MPVDIVHGTGVKILSQNINKSIWLVTKIDVYLYSIKNLNHEQRKSIRSSKRSNR
jgi:hypothetical protein